MNKKISQFELTDILYFQDTIPIVQENKNKNITISGLTTAFSNIFPTNDKLDELTDKVNAVDTKIEDSYNDLNNKIKEGDDDVTNNITSTVNSYYDILNDKIITLDEKHDKDITEVEEFITQE